ncbi:Uncharacterised protein [Mycobacteroides abscessus subsp. abscessus]|nr:Uncharacterised protein [Mycobacteroides abscessus subsp. abscessus]
MVVSTSAAASGFLAAIARPPSAWTIITDTEWATMSCNSRAIWLRVFTSAMRAACSRPRSRDW